MTNLFYNIVPTMWHYGEDDVIPDEPLPDDPIPEDPLPSEDDVGTLGFITINGSEYKVVGYLGRRVTEEGNEPDYWRFAINSYWEEYGWCGIIRTSDNTEMLVTSDTDNNVHVDALSNLSLYYNGAPVGIWDEIHFSSEYTALEEKDISVPNGYVGTSNGTKRISSGYVGVDNVARKIVAGYVGDENGKARLCFGKYDGFKTTDLPSFPVSEGSNVVIASGDGKTVMVEKRVLSSPCKDVIARCIEGNTINDVMLSTDISGSAWKRYLWQDIAYGNGLFVVVGYTASATDTYGIYEYEGVVAYSSDAENWTVKTVANSGSGFTEANGSAWKYVSYGNNIFVSVAEGGDIAYSSNGSQWTFTKDDSLYAPYCLTYGDGRFVAVAANALRYSTNGRSWSELNRPGNITQAAATSTVYVVTGYNICKYSTNKCVTWNDIENSTGLYWHHIAYCEDRFFAFAQEPTTRINYVLQSFDGINWSSILAPNRVWFNITYGTRRFIATAQDDGAVMTWDC